MTQKDLAQAIAEKPTVINEYESGGWGLAGCAHMKSNVRSIESSRYRCLAIERHPTHTCNGVAVPSPATVTFDPMAVE